MSDLGDEAAGVSTDFGVVIVGGSTVAGFDAGGVASMTGVLVTSAVTKHSLGEDLLLFLSQLKFIHDFSRELREL